MHLKPLKSVLKKVSNIQMDFRLWLIPLATCLINLTTMGSGRGESLIFVAIMEVEHLGRLQASLPYVFRGLALIITSPVLGIVGYHVSYFKMATSGLCLVVLGQIACFFSTNIYVISIFSGFVRVSGFTIMATQIPQIIGSVFKGSRATAMGFATLGQPLGGFVWPFCTHLFLDTYGLKGTFLLTAGVTLHSLIGVVYVSSYYNQHIALMDKKKLLMSEVKNIPSEIVDYDLEIDKKTCNKTTEAISSNEDKEARAEAISSNSKYEASVQVSTPEKQSNDGLAELEVEMKQIATSPEVVAESGTPIVSITKPSVSSLKILGRVLRSRYFYMLACTGSVNVMIQEVVNIIIVDYLADKGLERELALNMITLYAFGGLIGRVGLGWITDRGFLGANVHKIIMLSVSGLSLILTSYISVYPALCVCFVILGISQASIQTVNLVMLTTYFPGEDMLMAIASRRVFQGVLRIGRSPVIGFFRDYFGSYDFFLRGVSVLLYTVAGLWLYEEVITIRKTRNYKRVSTENEDEV